MEISLIDVNHAEQKAYVEFRSESVNANVTFTLSDLIVMEKLIETIRATLAAGKNDETE